MFAHILEIILKIVLYLVFEILLLLTGDVVLFAFSFGRLRPEWLGGDYGSVEQGSNWRKPAMWAGLGFWLLVILVLILSIL
ncbi:hypothetical protein KQI65_07035 [bacterium]|nr:hypothetical protein [bacterium]